MSRLMSCLTPAVLALLLAAALLPAAAQVGGATEGASSRVEIMLIVRVMGEQNFRVPDNLRVELLDNNHTPMMQSHTTSNGEARFRILLMQRSSGGMGATVTAYRVRVSGEGVETYTSDLFRIHAMQRTHSETVTVRPPPGAATSAAAPGAAATVSAAELKVPREAQRDFQRGNSALEQQQWAEAITHFEKAVAAYPDYAGAHNNLGVALMRSGQTERGRRAFARALELDANMHGASLNLARMAYADQQFDQVKELLHPSAALQPGNPEALMLLANAQLRTGELEEAVRHARMVHGLEHERFANAHLVAARALEILRRFEEAAAEYQLYLREAPDGDNASIAHAALQALAQRRAP